MMRNLVTDYQEILFLQVSFQTYDDILTMIWLLATRSLYLPNIHEVTSNDMRWGISRKERKEMGRKGAQIISFKTSECRAGGD